MTRKLCKNYAKDAKFYAKDAKFTQKTLNLRERL
jgi:hypothetical protein